MTIAVTFNTADNDTNSIQDDLDALARVAYAEAGEMYTYYKNMGMSDADAAKYSYGVTG